MAPQEGAVRMCGENCGVREKSLLEELETLPVEDHVKKRIIEKYWKEVNERRAELERDREKAYNRENIQVEKIQEQDVIIRALSNYIKQKELL